MALLGKDFSGTKPTDSDWSVHTSASAGASQLRSLKQAIQDFFAVSHNLESGALSGQAFDHNQAITPLDPDPSGTYREATINARGQVIRGVENPPATAKFRLRAYLTSDLTYTSVIEDTDGEVTTKLPATGNLLMRPTAENTSHLKTTTASWYAPRFDFIVPDRVTQLKYTIVSPYVAGWDPSAVGTFKVGSVSVSPGDTVEVYPGDSSAIPAAHSIGTRILVNDWSTTVGDGSIDRYHGTTIPNPDSPFGDGRVVHGVSPWANLYKQTTPGYGFCILEWYEI